MKRKKPLNLIHLANFNSTNIGNGALISGLESTLEEDLPRPISWSREPWDDYTFGLVDFDDGFVDKVNASDGLIVGGAVTFNGRDYNNRTGTRFELPLELWSKVTKPVVFYGLSYRHWPGQTYHHIDRLRMTIETILASDRMLLAVRNDGTRKWLTALTGINSKEIIEIPDQGVFVRAGDGYYPELREGARNIIVSFNDEDADHRFDQRHSVQGVLNRSRDHVIDGLVSTLERLADHFPINLILCPHYFDDYRMMSTFLERIRPRLAHQQMVSTGLCRVKDTPFFYGRYRRVDLSISMRVHSMSPCIGLGTPMIAYTTQDRMTDFMERIGLRDLTVDAFGESARDRLYEIAKFALEHGSEVRERFLQARASLREDVRRFNSVVYDFLTA
jgi:hypothetical protein